MDLINNPHKLGQKDNPRGTKKYNFLVKILDKEKKGGSIILPGDINSLLERLKLVCAERAAGNIQSTTPEIVAILDELLRRDFISKPEYNAVCKQLEC